jgi:hypothetical protein
MVLPSATFSERSWPHRAPGRIAWGLPRSCQTHSPGWPV